MGLNESTHLVAILLKFVMHAKRKRRENISGICVVIIRVNAGSAGSGKGDGANGLSPKSSFTVGSGQAGTVGGGGAGGSSPTPLRRFQRVEILQIAEGTQLIEPSEVVVSHGPASILTAEPILTPIGTSGAFGTFSPLFLSTGCFTFSFSVFLVLAGLHRFLHEIYLSGISRMRDLFVFITSIPFFPCPLFLFFNHA